jgi:hypothetical protein
MQYEASTIVFVPSKCDVGTNAEVWANVTAHSVKLSRLASCTSPKFLIMVTAVLLFESRRGAVCGSRRPADENRNKLHQSAT